MTQLFRTPVLILSFFFSSTLLLIDPNVLNLLTTVGSLSLAVLLNARKVFFNARRFYTLFTDYKKGIAELDKDFKDNDKDN